MKDDQLLSELLYLKLSFFREYHQSLAKEAVEKSWTHVDFLSRLPKARRSGERTARPTVESRPLASPSSKPSNSSIGHCPKRSTGLRFRICSAFRS